MTFQLAGKRIWIAGHRGMVGSALVRRLGREDCAILTVARPECDLRSQAAVERWLKDVGPDVAVVAAARVGGILANASSPAEFLYDNLMIAANVIHAAYRAGIAKLLFLGSSCIYPKFAPQPIKEESLLEGQHVDIEDRGHGSTLHQCERASASERVANNGLRGRGTQIMAF